jgi:hypothetical protein
MNHHCFLADQVSCLVEVEEVSCLLEVEGDHEVEMEDVQMEVGLVGVAANQEEVHLEKRQIIHLMFRSFNLIKNYLQHHYQLQENFIHNQSFSQSTMNT